MRLGNNQGKFVGAEAFVAQIRRVPRQEAEADVHSYAMRSLTPKAFGVDSAFMGKTYWAIFKNL
jgi:hypothetical protein